MVVPDGTVKGMKIVLQERGSILKDSMRTNDFEVSCTSCALTGTDSICCCEFEIIHLTNNL